LPTLWIALFGKSSRSLNRPNHVGMSDSRSIFGDHDFGQRHGEQVQDLGNVSPSVTSPHGRIFSHGTVAPSRHLLIRRVAFFLPGALFAPTPDHGPKSCYTGQNYDEAE
jgi:hypothetical protein